MTTTDRAALRWRPTPSDSGSLTEHEHADGDAYSRRHTHRLPYAEHPHVHGTHGDEIVDVATAPAALSGDGLAFYRAQNGDVRLRVTAESWLTGVLVDALAQIATGDVNLAELPHDPAEAAEWVAEHLAPLLYVQVTLPDPAAVTTALGAILPGVTR
jgi:hypothetical protein